MQDLHILTLFFSKLLESLVFLLTDGIFFLFSQTICPVWNTTFPMCTMPCMHTLTGTMWLSRALPSKNLPLLLILPFFNSHMGFSFSCPILLFKKAQIKKFLWEKKKCELSLYRRMKF